MTVSPSTISKALLRLVESFGVEDNVTAAQINTGLCADFADAFTGSFGNGTNIVNIEDLFEEARCGTARFSNASPPPGVDLETLGSLNMINDLHHCWIEYGGRHYDAEMIEGTANPFDLPCLRHGLHELMELRNPGLLNQLTEAHDWWRETKAVRDRREPLLLSDAIHTVAAPGLR